MTARDHLIYSSHSLSAVQAFHYSSFKHIHRWHSCIFEPASTLSYSLSDALHQEAGPLETTALLQRRELSQFIDRSLLTFQIEQ